MTPMFSAMMVTPAPKIFVIIQGLQILSALILMNQKEQVVEFVNNVMEVEIASIGQMVTIPANAELAARDVFMAPVGIIIQLAIQSETMKPVANVDQILV